MRIGIDGAGIALLNAKQLRLEGLDGELRRTVGIAADTSEFYPTGALALGASKVWIADKERHAVRVDRATGERERFGWQLIDAVYEAPGRLLGLRLHEDRMELVRFTDDAPEHPEPVSLPPIRELGWPYGSPYQTAVFKADWSRYGEARASVTCHGAAVIHESGLLFVRFADGEEVLWRTAPVYQGWNAAYVHAEGVVVTSLHNGRTGDIVWLDRGGAWVDCFDSQWHRMGPCVPATRGFLCWIDEDLVRFEGFPSRVVERLHVGGTDADLGVAPELTRVGVFAGRSVLRVEGEEAIRSAKESWEEEREGFERITDPWELPRPAFLWVEDPVLGRLPLPDEAAEASLARAAELLAAQPEGSELRARAAFMAKPLRWLPPRLDREKVLGALRRLAAGEERPRMAEALRAALPSGWRDREVREPVERWLREQVVHVTPREAGISPMPEAGALRSVELQADTSTGPVRWRLAVEAEHKRMVVLFDEFELECLSEVPDPEEPYLYRARLIEEDKEPIAGMVTVSRTPERWSYHLRFDQEAAPGRRPIRILAGGLFEGIDLEAAPDPELALRSLRAWGEPRMFCLGLREGRKVVDLLDSELEAPEALPEPSADPEAGPAPQVSALIEELVAAELLELSGPLTEATGRAIETIWIRHAGYLKKAAAKMEELLVEAGEVEELYGSAEEIEAIVRKVLG